MDFGAYVQIGDLSRLLDELNIDEPPRIRGLRLMLNEEKINDETSEQMRLFDSFVGKNVLYIHTRCGGSADNEYSNYVYCGMKEWEEKYKHCIVGAITDEKCITYRDTYIDLDKAKEQSNEL